MPRTRGRLPLAGLQATRYSARGHKNGYEAHRTEPFVRRGCFGTGGSPGEAEGNAKLSGRCDRRYAWVVATAFAAAGLAFPAIAAAESTETGAGRLAPAPAGAATHWTRAEFEDAEPLPIVELPGSAPGAPRTAATPDGATGATGAFQGTEVAATEVPYLANGRLVGEFRIPLNEREVKVEEYSCSASVVPSRRGNVILTAAHCVIDPETGTVATEGKLNFAPGYHNGIAPDGIWEASSYEATKSWSEWARKKVTPPNEGEDLAFLLLRSNQEGEDVQDVAGSLGIAFDQACTQTYTQYGYPAESPYDGQILYSHISPYAGTDLNPAIAPRPIKIASDFTRGSSGGPWTIGASTAPTALSVTAYGYENQPGYLYGPYFGEAARKAYERASGRFIATGIEETCAALPEIPAIQPPAPAPTPTPQPEPAPVRHPLTLKLMRVHTRANGSAVLIVKIRPGGMLKLSGAAVRADSLHAPAAGKYRLVVKPKRATTRRLRRVGRAKVGVKVAFRTAGKTKRVRRKIQLSRRLARPTRRGATRSR